MDATDVLLSRKLVGAAKNGPTVDKGYVDKAVADTLKTAQTYSDTQLGIVAQRLEDDKANYTYKVIATDKVSQADAREILTFLDQYEGKLIEFLTNGENPSKCVATGRTMADVGGNTYLVTFNLDGTTTVWTRDTFEKHNFECRSFINEPMVDLDNFTIDVQGDAPYVASVRNPMNNPGEAGENGIIAVIAYSIDKQIQLYRDIDTGKKWFRLVTGTADKHSFGIWTVD